MALYRIYLDEVGNSSMKVAAEPVHNFLTLAGVIVESTHYTDVLQPQFETFKRKYFGYHPDEPVIMHRSELKDNKPPFEALADPARKNAFDEEWLQLLGAWEFSVIGVLLDKQAHCAMFEFWKHNPYHYCLEVIVELYHHFLHERSGRGDVMIENRGGKEDMQLKTAFRQIYTDGTHNLPAGSLQQHLTSREIKIKPKIANIAGLQLADLLAFPCNRHIIKHYNLASYTQQTFSEKVINILAGKLYCFHGGHCGIRHLPAL